MPTRKVIIHYHIFKNAGTSIDRMLRESFGDKWINYDKDQPAERISAAEMETYILDHPEIIAFSSHHLVPPLPTNHLEVYPIIFLRHPVDRAYSAYLFEWQKQQQSKEPIGSFEEYITEKFKYPRQNAIEDFQAFHLANRSYQNKFPRPGLDDESILGNARQLLNEAGYFGLVDLYPQSLRLLESKLSPHFTDLKFVEHRENALQDKSLSLPQKIAQIRQTLDQSAYTALVMRNQLDFRLYEFALGVFSQLYKSLPN